MHEEEERTAQGHHPGALRTENAEVALLIFSMGVLTKKLTAWEYLLDGYCW